MDKDVTDFVLDATGADGIQAATRIQSLWSGYGEIVRLSLTGGRYTSVILKHVKLLREVNHPRGWNTAQSHQRKVHSYRVEARWYQDYASRCDSYCEIPACLRVHSSPDETLLLLTDLDASGFDVRKESVNIGEMHACLDWLASFHATFLGSEAQGLWESGTYWHLATRPDELAALEDERLRAAAPLIDAALAQTRFPTWVHGDAKLANFCFTANVDEPRVAAVDFQYVGRGCGMKDVAYFIGSCLHEADCEALAAPLLDYYFAALAQRLQEKQPGADAKAVEAEWRSLYDVAWADFHRFLKGWSPGHWKLNSYSERLTRDVIARLMP